MATVYYLHKLGIVDIRIMHELGTTSSAGLFKIICDIIYTAVTNFIQKSFHKIFERTSFLLI